MRVRDGKTVPPPVTPLPSIEHGPWDWHGSVSRYPWEPRPRWSFWRRRPVDEYWKGRASV